MDALRSELPLLALKHEPKPTDKLLDDLVPSFDMTLGRIIAFAARLSPDDGEAVTENEARLFCALVRRVSQVSRKLSASTTWYDVGNAMQLPFKELNKAFDPADGTEARKLVMTYCKGLHNLLEAAQKALDKLIITDDDLDRAVWFCRRGSSLDRAMRTLMVRNTYGTELTRTDRSKQEPPTISTKATALQHLIEVNEEEPPPPEKATQEMLEAAFAPIVATATFAGIKAWIATFKPTDGGDIMNAVTSALMVGRVDKTRLVASLLGFGPLPLFEIDDLALLIVYEGLDLAPDQALYLNTLHDAMGDNAPGEGPRVGAVNIYLEEQPDGMTAAAIIMHGGADGMLSAASTAGIVSSVLWQGHAETLLGFLPVFQAMTPESVGLTFERLTSGDFPVFDVRFSLHRLLDQTFALEQEAMEPLHEAFDAARIRVGLVSMVRVGLVSMMVMVLVPEMMESFHAFESALGPPGSPEVQWTAVRPLLVKLFETLGHSLSNLPPPSPPYPMAQLFQLLGVTLSTPSSLLR